MPLPSTAGRNQDAANQSTIHRTVRDNSLAAQNVNDAEAEKLCP